MKRFIKKQTVVGKTAALAEDNSYKYAPAVSVGSGGQYSAVVLKKVDAG